MWSLKSEISDGLLRERQCFEIHVVQYTALLIITMLCELVLRDIPLTPTLAKANLKVMSPTLLL
jgi:hypothetical protein